MRKGASGKIEVVVSHRLGVGVRKMKGNGVIGICLTVQKNEKARECVVKIVVEFGFVRSRIMFTKFKFPRVKVEYSLTEDDYEKCSGFI